MNLNLYKNGILSVFAIASLAIAGHFIIDVSYADNSRMIQLSSVSDAQFDAFLAVKEEMYQANGLLN